MNKKKPKQVNAKQNVASPKKLIDSLIKNDSDNKTRILVENNKTVAAAAEEEEMVVNDLNRTTKSSGIQSQKREIVLVKDENLGFGFIAGSEKPLVIRFVSPGN